MSNALDRTLNRTEELLLQNRGAIGPRGVAILQDLLVVQRRIQEGKLQTKNISLIRVHIDKLLALTGE